MFSFGFADALLTQFVPAKGGLLRRAVNHW
jgi:hypothetical protein